MFSNFLPYARQTIDAADIRAVMKVLRSSHLTTGPTVENFENKFADRVGAKYAVAVSSGTSALHTALVAAGIGPKDEVVTTPYSFAATSNAILHAGAVPVFVDIRPDTFNIDPDRIEKKIGKRTKAVVAVHFAGLPCDLDPLQRICRRHGLKLIEDAAHALGAVYRGRPIGSVGDLTTFSFHPAKHITTGEGGMITTSSNVFAERMRRFRNHGITADVNQRNKKNSWKYDIDEIGYNYRLSDIHCALGMSQLDNLRRFVDRRRKIAAMYLSELKDLDAIVLPEGGKGAGTKHSWHLFMIRLRLNRIQGDRDAVFRDMRQKGIGVTVHYLPIHLFKYYRTRLGCRFGDFPNAERLFQEALSLPLFPSMTRSDVRRVVMALKETMADMKMRP